MKDVEDNYSFIKTLRNIFVDECLSITSLVFFEGGMMSKTIEKLKIGHRTRFSIKVEALAALEVSKRGDRVKDIIPYVDNMEVAKIIPMMVDEKFRIAGITIKKINLTSFNPVTDKAHYIDNPEGSGHR